MALARFRPHALAALVAGGAVAISWAFAWTVLRNTRSMGLPLDDSYIYLTYAKQFGRGEPFTYFSGGGYSAGSTSVVWPMLLAPFWTLGARGHALVWVSYVLCTGLYAATAIGVWRVVRQLASEQAGVLGALALLGIAPFAWTSLSGMEVAFASVLLLATILLLIRQAPTGPPSRRLAVCLAALSLSRPEATLLVLGVIGVAVLGRLRKRELRAAAWWLAPLAAPLAWVVANKAIAGNLFPNTGVAKSYFYLPGFDWTYWRSAVWSTSGKMLKGLFWDPGSPLVWPKLVALAWLVGAVRVMLWARRARRMLAGVLVVASPFVLLFAVVASSGLWSFQNYRYIGPVFPLLMIPVGVALAPCRGERMSPIVAALAEGVAVIAIALQVAPVLPLVTVVVACLLAPLAVRWARRAHAAVTALVLAMFAYVAVPRLAADARLFAQGAVDTNTQVVAIGNYLHAKLPDASVMFHDAGAIAYYGDGKVYDMLGLVTNHQAGIANHGAGARFEFLEDLPPEQRPTHFAYYPSWLGTDELYGDVLLQTPLRPRIPGLTKAPLVGDTDMQVIVASFDHVGTGEHPLTEHAGWRVVDRIDVANLASEQAHGWRGALGRRKTLDPTARWSFVGREVGAHGLILDGGRTIRGGPSEPPGERFSIEVEPGKPVRLVLRTGGEVSYPYHEAIAQPVVLELLDDDDRVVATATIGVPNRRFSELAFDLPAGISRTLHTEAAAPYRAFHWFVLQPE